MAIAIAAGVVGAFYIAKLPAALPALKSELGLSLVDASWAVSAFNILALIAAPLFGLAADRTGALRFVLGGLVLMIVGALVAVTGADPRALVASRIIEGAGFIATAIAAPALITVAAAPAHRKLALGVWSAYMPLGGSLTMFAAPFVIAAGGWRALWLIVAALTALCALALLAMRSHFRGAGPRAPRPFRAALRPFGSPAVRWLGLAFAFYTAQFMTIMVWLPTFLVARGVSLPVASALTAGYVTSNVPGNLLGAWLLQRGATRGGLIAGASLLMGAFGVAAFVSALPDTARYIAVLGLSLVGGIIPAAVLSASHVHARTASEIGSVQSLFVQGSNLGQFVGPPAVAALVAATGEWSMAVVVLGAAAALGSVAGLRVAHHERTLAKP